MKKYCYLSNAKGDITFHNVIAEHNTQYTLKRMSKMNTSHHSPIIRQNGWQFIHLILDPNQLVHIQV